MLLSGVGAPVPRCFLHGDGVGHESLSLALFPHSSSVVGLSRLLVASSRDSATNDFPTEGGSAGGLDCVVVMSSRRGIEADTEAAIIKLGSVILRGVCDMVGVDHLFIQTSHGVAALVRASVSELAGLATTISSPSNPNRAMMFEGSLKGEAVVKGKLLTVASVPPPKARTSGATTGDVRFRATAIVV